MKWVLKTMKVLGGGICLVMMLDACIGDLNSNTNDWDGKWYRQEVKGMSPGARSSSTNPVLPLDPAQRPCATSDISDPGCNN